MRFDGQQRVMRLSGAPLGSPAEESALTNRMREIFTCGSVGGAGSNPGPYPAGNRHRAFSFDGTMKFEHHHCSQRQSPVAVPERWRSDQTHG